MDLINKLGIGIGAALAIGGTVANGVAVHKTAKKIDCSVKDLAKKTSEGIADDICRKAVDVAAAKAVEKNTSDLMKKARESMDSRLNKVVEQESGLAQERIEDELMARIDEIDTDQMAIDIRNKVSDKIADDLYKNYQAPSQSQGANNSNLALLINKISELDSDYEKTQMMQSIMRMMKGE